MCPLDADSVVSEKINSSAICKRQTVVARPDLPISVICAGWFSFIGEAALAGGSAASIVALIVSLMQVNYSYTVTPVQQLAIYTGLASVGPSTKTLIFVERWSALACVAMR